MCLCSTDHDPVGTPVYGKQIVVLISNRIAIVALGAQQTQGSTTFIHKKNENEQVLGENEHKLLELVFLESMY